MPHKKWKRKTIPKHKKKGVKLIAKHKISADYPNNTNITVGAHGTQKNIPRIAIKGKSVCIPAVQNKKKKQLLQLRRLPVEVMPCNDSGTAKSQLIAPHLLSGTEREMQLMDFCSSVGEGGFCSLFTGEACEKGMCDKSAPHGTEWNRDTVRVIDNISDSLKKKEPYGDVTDSSDKQNTKVINLIQAKKIREQVWIHHNGKNFETKCYVSWCTNMVDVFNFQVGHDTPKALGGSNTLLNLKPICQNCNQSMGSRYSIAEWNQLFPIQQRRHTVCTGIESPTQSNATASTSFLHPPGVGLKLNVGGMATLTTVVKLKNVVETISNGAISTKLANIDNMPNKIDLYITETDTQQQTKDTNTNVAISPPLYTIQKMNYGPLARLVSYTTESSSLSPIKNVQPIKNLIIQGGITVFGAAIIAGSWLFGY